MPEHMLKATNVESAKNSGLVPAITFETLSVEEDFIEAPPVFGVYKRHVDIQNDSWKLTSPLFSNEESANYRRDDLNNISHAHGLLTEFKVEELEVENDYAEVREFMYNGVEQEALGINANE